MFAESTSDNLPVICPFSPLAELYWFRGLALRNLLWTCSHKLRQFKKNFLFPGQQLIRMDTFILSRALVCILLLWSVVALFMLEYLFRVSFFPWCFFRCAFSSLWILTRKWVLIAHALPFYKQRCARFQAGHFVMGWVLHGWVLPLALQVLWVEAELSIFLPCFTTCNLTLKLVQSK